MTDDHFDVFCDGNCTFTPIPPHERAGGFMWQCEDCGWKKPGSEVGYDVG